MEQNNIDSQALKNDKFLDSIDSKTSAIFEKIYIVLAFWLVLSPLGASLFALVGLKLELLTQGIMIGIFFGVTWFIQFAFNLTKIRFKKPDLFQIFAMVSGVLLLVSLLVSGVDDYNYILKYFSYIMAFLLFVKVDKKYFKLILFVFIIEMSVDSIFGLIDAKNKWFPGFTNTPYCLSMQFMNPNYSAYSIVGVIGFCLYFFLVEEKLWKQIVLGVCFVIMNVFLFINGTFVAETALFLIEIALLVYYWIKNKKCPYWIWGAIGVSLVCSCFCIPGISSSYAPYMVEGVAIIDDQLGTNFLEFFTKLFTSSGDGMSTVTGADGRGRKELVAMALELCTGDAKTLFFGKGLGYCLELRVHNLFLWLWLDFGILFAISFYALAVSLIVMFAKSKNKSKTFIFLMVTCMYLFMYNFGVFDFSFLFFMVFYSMLYSKTKSNMV